MLAALALIPSAPVLVPELAGDAAAEVADLRAAVHAAAAALPDRWIAIGAADIDTVIDQQAVGTFAGYGADVPVTLAPAAAGPVTELPLCALMAGWVRAQAAPRAAVQVRAYSAGHEVDVALACGRALRAEIDASADPVGVLVVADGANTLTPSAPGGYHPDAATIQQTLDDALAAGDVTTLTQLPDTIVGRVAYQVLAGLGAPTGARELYRGAPYGVGYFAGIWRP